MPVHLFQAGINNILQMDTAIYYARQITKVGGNANF